MRFFDTRALLFPRNGIHLQWGVEPEGTDLEMVEMEIHRSESPSGPFINLQTLNPLETFAWTDRTAPLRAKRFELYYKLVGTNRSTGVIIHQSQPFGFQGRLPLDALEIIRQHNILLRGVNGHDPTTGIKTTVYKKKTFGVRCQYCTDEATKQIVISQCKMCGGTGLVNGYYSPIPVYMNFQPTPKMLRVMNLGKIEEHESVAFLTNFPIMYPGDMVVEPDEKHWKVSGVEITERKRTIVHQLVRIRQLDHNDVEYELYKHVDNQGLR